MTCSKSIKDTLTTESTTMYLLLIFIIGTYGECLYTHPEILMCKNIDAFNISSSQAVFLDITHSNLTHVPLLTLDHWPRLEFITLRNSTVSTCSEILKQTDIFYIDHDCKPLSVLPSVYPPILPSEYPPIIKGQYHWPIIIVGSCLAIASIIFIYNSVRRYHDNSV